jgi:uncharacterized protein involved in outer membrane biogenesis
MSGGRISNLLLELVGLDAGEALSYLFRNDRTVTLRCAVADTEVKDGVVISRATVIDTSDTNVKVDGQVDLRDESLDLTVHPLPKDYSLLSLRSPLHVTGRLKTPTVRPDKELLIRGGVAAVLGVVATPLAAIIPLIENGPGDDADCEKLMAALSRHTRAPDVAAR